jgi:crotonobetainyl-CoA:carnitine CoA-transferase CaiB-like acyl-CoA transferase
MAGNRRRTDRTKATTPEPAAALEVRNAPTEPIAEPQQHTDEPQMRAEPSREEIERRAYDRYMQRGGRDGGALDDWLAAEQELRPE